MAQNWFIVRAGGPQPSSAERVAVSPPHFPPVCVCVSAPRVRCSASRTSRPSGRTSASSDCAVRPTADARVCRSPATAALTRPTDSRDAARRYRVARRRRSRTRTPLGILEIDGAIARTSSGECLWRLRDMASSRSSYICTKVQKGVEIASPPPYEHAMLRCLRIERIYDMSVKSA